MKLTAIETAVPVVALVVASLAACGGGGDDAAGSATALSVQPGTFTLTASAGSASGVCSSGLVGPFVVYGGAAPYHLDAPGGGGFIALDRDTVDSRGGSFNVTYFGSCFAPMSVVIVDKNDRQTILTLNNKPAS